MRLISCNIENFGRLHNYSLDFSQDIHTICEDNGWGKSTLAAFLRVMFFGLQNNNKKNDIDNDRRRYRPWQGGVFGGSLVFVAHDKKYILTRQFADKEADDFFELRDYETNLISQDFSSNIGEELFKINNDSFIRSVFISQNDCVTSATDSINAKIGDISDNTGDIDSFDKANEIFKKFLNQNSPNFAKGSIRRMNDERSALYNELLKQTSIDEAIRSHEERIKENTDKLDIINNEKLSLKARDEELKKDAINNKLRANYENLCQEKERAQKEVDRLSGIDEDFSLSSDDSDRLLNLQAEFSGTENYFDEAAKITECYKDYKRLLKEADDKNKELDYYMSLPMPKKSPFMLVIGIILFMLSIPAFFLVDMTVGVSFSGIALVFIFLQIPYSKSVKDPNEAIKNLLSRQIEEAEADLTDISDELKKMLSRHDIYASEEEFYESISTVNNRAREYDLLLRKKTDLIAKKMAGETALERALADLRIRSQRLAIFIEENDMSKISGKALSDDGLSFDDINIRMSELEKEEAKLVDDIAFDRRSLDSLYERSDELLQKRERFNDLEGKIEAAKEKYELVELSQKFLVEAKEKLTNEYTRPLLSSFNYYYGIVAGDDDKFFMDANSNITVEEYGIQRNIYSLSQGLRDVIGLCLRISFVDAMYPNERPVLFLDDPFVNLDDEKMGAARSLLEEISAKYQIIYFTCTKSRA